MTISKQHKQAVSIEWIVLASSIKYVATIIIKMEFTYRLSDRQLDDIFERGNTVPHEHAYTQRETTKNARNHGNLTKRTSELRERAINSKKRSQCHLSFRRM